MKKKLQEFSLFIKYGGLTKEEYDAVYPRIVEKNREILVQYSFVVVLLTAVLTFVAMFVPTIANNVYFYVALLLTMLAIYLCGKIVIKKHKWLAMPMCDVFAVAVYIFSICVGVFTKPDVGATTFFVLGLAMPLIFISVPLKIICQIVLVNVIFCFFAVQYKNTEIVVEDITNSVIFAILGIIVNCYMAKVKHHDILGAYKSEVHIREMAEKDIMLNNIISNMPGGIIIYKVAEKLETLYTSDGIPGMLGRTKEEYEELLKDDLIQAAIYEKDIPDLLEAIRENVPQGKPVNGTYRIKHKEGYPVWVLISAVKIREEDGAAIYYAVFSVVPEQVGNYASICEDAPVPVYITDKENYEVLYCNKLGKQLLNDDGTANSKKCYEYIMNRTTPCEYCKMHEVSGDETVEHSMVSPYNKSMYTLHGKTIDWNGRQGYLAYLSDDTYRIQAMEESEKLKKAREENMAKNNFLARMSHDLRTPLNAIIGFSSREMLKNTSDYEKEEYFSKIQTSSRYLLSMINDILDMSKMESGNVKLNMQEYYFEDIFSGISHMIWPIAMKKKIAIKLAMKNVKVGSVLVDRRRLEQIFVNILTNAIKYSKEGSIILVCVEQFEVTQRRQAFRISIRDFGIGMSEEFLPRVFDAFARESNEDGENSGTGLGLAIVSNIVKMMHGTISVDSKLGAGTTFVVELPYIYTKKNLEKQRTTERKVSENMLEGKKVLLCEDHPLNAEIAKRLLQTKGCEVTVANNGKIGVEIFESSAQSQFDIILMDIRMPVMDGIEATRAIRALEREDAKDIPIIAMTANAFDEDVKISLDAGMNEHLAKPVNPKNLYSVLEKYLDK